jgi:hypothetical protein
VTKYLAALLLPSIALAQSGAVGTTGVYNSTSPALTNGQIQTIQLDSQGRLIDAPLQVGAGGTVNLSGVPVVTPTTYGNIKPGLAPKQGEMLLGQYNPNLPILSGTQTVGLQTDNAGRLLIGSIYALPPVQLAPMARGLPAVTLPPVSFPSYRATGGNFPLAASPTDFACLSGNATNTVLLDEVHFNGTETQANTEVIFLQKHSTADTGSSNALTAVPDDSRYPAASSAAVDYTPTNPTQGTVTGSLDISYVTFGEASGAPTSASPTIGLYMRSFESKPIILRGTAEQVCLSMNGTVNGVSPKVSFEFHWYEVSNLASFTP